MSFWKARNQASFRADMSARAIRRPAQDTSLSSIALRQNQQKYSMPASWSKCRFVYPKSVTLILTVTWRDPRSDFSTSCMLFKFIPHSCGELINFLSIVFRSFHGKKSHFNDSARDFFLTTPVICIKKSTTARIDIGSVLLKHQLYNPSITCCCFSGFHG